MVSSRRGLAILGGVVAVLAAALAVDVARGRGAESRELVAGLDVDRVDQLVWLRRGAPDVRLAKVSGAWQWDEPLAGPADARAVSDVLAALRGARWHRRGDVRAVGELRGSLAVRAGGEAYAIDFAGPLEGTEQAWLVVRGRALLVDRWVARALDPPAVALRVQQPLADAAAAGTIVVERVAPPLHVRVTGRPRTAGGVLVDPARAAALERALAALTIVALPSPAPPPAADALAITVDRPALVTVELGGACAGGLVAVRGTLGVGCVDRAAADAVEAAAAALAQPAAQIVERRPLPAELTQLVLADGATLSLTGRARIGTRDAELARIAEILAALAAPGEPTALPTAPPRATLTATERGGATRTLDLYAPDLVARRGEPLALRIGAGAWQLLARPSGQLADLALWLEEPTTIARIGIDATTYVRGASVGEWFRAGRPAPATVEPLATALAAPRGLAVHAGPFIARHLVTLAIAPPGGSPIEHALALGGPGCIGRTADTVVDLPPALCAAVDRLAR